MDDDFEEYEEIDFDDDLPDPACAEIMAAVDAMPKAWRMLVYEYGYQIVSAMRAEYRDPNTVCTILQVRNRARQDEWLATDFITPRSRRGFEAIN